MTALLTVAMGVVNVISATMPAARERLRLLEQFSPLEVTRGSRLATVLAGFALLLLSTNLWRRKQAAWLLTIAVLVASAFSHLLKGLDYEEASIAVLLALFIFSLRPHFHARSDVPSVRQGIRVLLAAALFTLAYGTLGFYLLDRHFKTHFELIPALTQTLAMFTEFATPGLQPVTRFGRYFVDSIYIIAGATLSYGFYMLVRPVLIRQPATAEERKRAREIVEAHGQTSLARMTLFDDKSYFFSAGETMFAYVVKGRVALALGDPIGPGEDAKASILEFKKFCAVNDWDPCFDQTQPDDLPLYKETGFKFFSIGEEAIVDLSAFTLEGKAGKEFRNVTNRLGKLGHRVEVIEPPLSRELLDELKAVSDEWLSMTHGSEMRFSLGWFDDEYVRNGRVAVVRAAEGRVSAFANIVTEYQRNEVSLDLMRRAHRIENGTMDLLFVSLFDWAKQKGFDTFSLGLSGLSGIGEKSDDPAVEKILRLLSDHLSRFYNFKGLHAFKEKF
ncbi:MAG: bifunctional lysylphosphatidylglycerol flippase/synthetase MprF, partial [Anaerolineales bacterium]|nr:bifunctional lysylphosphatidylglycerol flippase/synthetase MprF [Anaerolineales bacterium]